MPIITTVLNTFMTRTDEEDFSAKIISALPTVRYIDNFVWDEASPPLSTSIAECYGRANSGVSIINESIVTLTEYVKNWVRPHPGGQGYFGPTLAKGIIQFEHSKKANYTPGGLRNGKIAASYDSDFDPETELFVKAIWKIFKDTAIKLYAIDPHTGLYLKVKAETKIFAWPDAIKEFDQVNNAFLTNNTMAYYTSKKP